VSQSTLDACGDHVVAESRGPIPVKGKAKPVPVYAVTDIRESAPASSRYPRYVA
jgi:class 3 adenylate cyclase